MTADDAPRPAAAPSGAPSEESREARGLEATLVAHALGANGLWGAFEAPSSAFGAALATLRRGRAPQRGFRSRVQALHEIAQAWFGRSRPAGIVALASASPGFASSRPT